MYSGKIKVLHLLFIFLFITLRHHLQRSRWYNFGHESMTRIAYFTSYVHDCLTLPRKWLCSIISYISTLTLLVYIRSVLITTYPAVLFHLSTIVLIYPATMIQVHCDVFSLHTCPIRRGTYCSGYIVDKYHWNDLHFFSLRINNRSDTSPNPICKIWALYSINYLLSASTSAQCLIYQLIHWSLGDLTEFW